MILNEKTVTGHGNKTYYKANKSRDEIKDEDTEYTKRLGFKITETEKVLPIMFWVSKMHKKLISARFIIAYKICFTKKISKSVSKHAFKLVYSQIEKFHKNAKFLSNYNKFWVSKNFDPIIQSLNNN